MLNAAGAGADGGGGGSEDADDDRKPSLLAATSTVETMYCASLNCYRTLDLIFSDRFCRLCANMFQKFNATKKISLCMTCVGPSCSNYITFDAAWCCNCYYVLKAFNSTPVTPADTSRNYGRSAGFRCHAPCCSRPIWFDSSIPSTLLCKECSKYLIDCYARNVYKQEKKRCVAPGCITGAWASSLCTSCLLFIRSRHANIDAQRCYVDEQILMGYCGHCDITRVGMYVKCKKFGCNYMIIAWQSEGYCLNHYGEYCDAIKAGGGST